MEKLAWHIVGAFIVAAFIIIMVAIVGAHAFGEGMLYGMLVERDGGADAGGCAGQCSAAGR